MRLRKIISPGAPGVLWILLIAFYSFRANLGHLFTF